MNRTLIALLLTGWLTSFVAAAEKRPNVLLIMSDDLNVSLGCYGHARMKTPNVDRLAARGVRFERAYCSYPLCGPSRNSMLTGLYTNTTGIQQNGQIFRQTIPTQHSLPQALRLQGYFAARIGKMFHYNVPNSIGTNGHDDPGSWEVEANPAGVDRMEEEPQIFSLIPGQFGGTLSWYASPKSDRYHTDALQAADAQWILERCAKQTDRPFFLGLGFFRPHTPYVAPKDPYFGYYPESEMPVVQGVKEDQADIPAPALGSAKKEQDKMTDDQRRQAVQAYFASISFMDTQLGQVLDALDRLGLAGNTIIVFTSDHGYHLGEHGLWQKMSLFEESTRVPLLIAGPGIPQGAVVKSPVSHVDVFPTVAELCQITPPKNLQGQSLLPLLKDPSKAGRGWALTQVMRGDGGAGRAKPLDAGSQGPARFFGYTLRTPRWRYTEWDEGRRGRELYDHDADERELKNLAEDSNYTSTVSELSQQLHKAAATTFPPSGEIPPIKPGLWAPNLTNP